MRRRCSTSKRTSRPAASSASSTPWRCVCRTHSSASVRTVASSATCSPSGSTRCCRARDTSSTSSTMRDSRCAFCCTIAVSWRCAGSTRSSPSSALACVMAASGLRISCATAADMRPMAASFSVRMRASSSRRSCRNITHRLSASRSVRAASGGCARAPRAARPAPARPGFPATAALRRAKVCARQRGQRTPGRVRRRARTAAPSAPGPGRGSRRPPGWRHAPGPAASTTSTPSLSVSITRSLTSACICAALRLRCASASSRASRRASSCASSATTNRPVPVSAKK